MWHAIVIVIALWFVVAYTKSEAPPRPMHAKGESPQSMHRASDLHLLNLSESRDQAIPNKPCLLDLRPSMLHPAKVIGRFDLRPRNVAWTPDPACHIQRGGSRSSVRCGSPLLLACYGSNGLLLAHFWSCLLYKSPSPRDEQS